jgi:hypothetical protein
VCELTGEGGGGIFRKLLILPGRRLGRINGDSAKSLAFYFKTHRPSPFSTLRPAGVPGAPANYPLLCCFALQKSLGARAYSCTHASVCARVPAVCGLLIIEVVVQHERDA